ncbi:MAG: DNA polymerase III subunit gamma/tau [Saprospiraceae bacterium]
MSDFVVSARKYRPQRFSDVLGQEHVTKTLKNALLRNNLAHAFLFTGPRGVGKTTCARILAKVINCQNAIANKDGEPCNVCDSCRMFDEQASFNILEMDAASNNSVEAMRSLVDQVRYQPQHGKYKVFIIDEVHMLSSSAFNAFLKTLEEPPPHAIFILATTERHKILPTILSRCQVYDFRRIQNEEIVKQLSAVAKDQQIKTEDDALHIIAQKADGSMRDALSIFDRIASFGEKKVTYADTIANLNVLDHEYYFKLVYALLREDSIQVLNTYREIHQLGFDGNLFIDGLAEHLRQLLVSKDRASFNLLEGSEDLQTKYIQQGLACSTAFILDALAIANDCDVLYDKARNKRLHVELALIRIAYLHRLTTSKPDLTELVEKKNPEPEINIISEPVYPSVSKIIEVEVFDQSEEDNPDDDMPSFNPGLTSKDSLATPKIGSLKSIQKRAARSIKSSSDSAVELKIETFQKTWNQYLETSELIISLKTILTQAELVLDKTKLMIMVGSNHAKNIIQLEHALLEGLRRSVSDKRLEIAIVLDPEKAKLNEDNLPKKMLTNKEKYEIMKQSNPAIDELIKVFKLKIDHGS